MRKKSATIIMQCLNSFSSSSLSTLTLPCSSSALATTTPTTTSKRGMAVGTRRLSAMNTRCSITANNNNYGSTSNDKGLNNNNSSNNTCSRGGQMNSITTKATASPPAGPASSPRLERDGNVLNRRHISNIALQLQQEPLPLDNKATVWGKYLYDLLLNSYLDIDRSSSSSSGRGKGQGEGDDLHLLFPNLGYAGDNLTLKAKTTGSRKRQKVSTERTCIKRTLEAQGIPLLSSLALANCKDLVRVLQWNADTGINFYRITSNLFPWLSECNFELERLPDYEEIVKVLGQAGEVARAFGQRLTMHPSHFIKLATKDNDELVRKSLAELEVHSKVFDLMGYSEPSPWNKINIHVGGVYGSKTKSLSRWACNYEKLSDACRSRLTVENDDRCTYYSITDLLHLHNMCGVPLVFDFHHHQFCPGGQSQQEALEAALSTWPAGIRPVVHWSEMPECPELRRTRPHAHSKYVYGPIDLYGRDGDVDVIIEAKARDLALLLYREVLSNQVMRLDDWVVVGGGGNTPYNDDNGEKVEFAI